MSAPWRAHVDERGRIVSLEQIAPVRGCMDRVYMPGTLVALGRPASLTKEAARRESEELAEWYLKLINWRMDRAMGAPVSWQ